MKKQTKHEKIIALYKEGMKPKDIAAKLKTTVQSVYAVKHAENKKSIQKTKDKISDMIGSGPDCFIKSVTYDGKVLIPTPDYNPIGYKTGVFAKFKRFLFGV